MWSPPSVAHIVCSSSTLYFSRQKENESIKDLLLYWWVKPHHFKLILYTTNQAVSVSISSWLYSNLPSLTLIPPNPQPSLSYKRIQKPWNEWSSPHYSMSLTMISAHCTEAYPILPQWRVVQNPRKVQWRDFLVIYGSMSPHYCMPVTNRFHWGTCHWQVCLKTWWPTLWPSSSKIT